MEMKKILQVIDSASTPVEPSKMLSEGANPHKVSLPVQMAMQHYQQPTGYSTSVLKKYFLEAEEAKEKELAEEKEQLKLRSQELAQRVMEKKASLRTSNPCWKGYKPVGTKVKNGKTVPNCVPKK